jgi:hypothetical protein
MAHLRHKPARDDNAGQGSRFRGGKMKGRLSAAVHPSRSNPWRHQNGNRRPDSTVANSSSSLTMMVTSQPSLAHTRAFATAISELILSILTVSFSRSATILYVIKSSPYARDTELMFKGAALTAIC